MYKFNFFVRLNSILKMSSLDFESDFRQEYPQESDDIDPRDEIIARNKLEIQQLNDMFNKISTDLRNELNLYAERATNLQNAMFYRISQLKEQIRRKEQLFETVNAPLPNQNDKKTTTKKRNVKKQK